MLTSFTNARVGIFLIRVPAGLRRRDGGEEQKVKGEKLRTKSFAAFGGLACRWPCFALFLSLFILSFSLFSLNSFAQKPEHYNSPLYSPRVYDPSQSVTTGLPDALKTVGIEQKLGEQLPLDTSLTDEDGKTVRLGSYFNTGRPVILALVYY